MTPSVLADAREHIVSILVFYVVTSLNVAVSVNSFEEHTASIFRAHVLWFRICVYLRGRCVPACQCEAVVLKSRIGTDSKTGVNVSSILVKGMRKITNIMSQDGRDSVAD
jgi:hypothetical protein